MEQEDGKSRRMGVWLRSTIPSRLPVFLLILLCASACRQRSSSGGDDGGAALPPPEADPDSGVGRGYAAVIARNCAECHQPSDPVDGVLSGQTTPVAGTSDYGSNLTPDPDTGLDGWTAHDVAVALQAGTNLDGGALCPSMPRYPEITDDEGSDIAAYLASLVPVRRPIPASGCSH